MDITSITIVFLILVGAVLLVRLLVLKGKKKSAQNELDELRKRKNDDHLNKE